ncbi:pilin [Halomonas sediminis]
MARAEASSGLSTVSAYKTEVDDQIYAGGKTMAEVSIKDDGTEAAVEEAVSSSLGAVLWNSTGTLTYTFASGVHVGDTAGTIVLTRADNGTWKCEFENLAVDELRGCKVPAPTGD